MELPFEQHLHRRRLYLLRHAEALDVSKGSYEYPTTLSLTELGRQQAAVMRDHLQEVTFDWAYSSDVQRAVETGAVVLEAHRDVQQGISPAFAELKAETRHILAGVQSVEEGQRQIAHFLERVDSIAAEAVHELNARVEQAVEKLLRDDWRVGLLCAHGVFNRFLICRLLGLDISHVANFEQDYCCLNILDLDIDNRSGGLARCVVRALNITPYDHTKSDLRYSDGEKVALALQGILEQKLGA